MNKIKLCTNIPEPPQITEEIKKQLAEEAKIWRAEMAKKVKAAENITAEDLRVIAK